uniref:uncharacterized protein LOC104266497 isoform X1 n=1 Tax=Ciona intestinalis TaxID=7719 RepID=UPI000521C3F5|nr:uncharacterized protein LOC104266497 isoform X1 [Ciona intestinalis]|eukprot:XP_009861163.1 uncharacterized protein LOC104266497 isoform X1 [Ciona intestinalis]
MASSCGAFHEEALRRQRVIDKKRVALQRLKATQAEEIKMAEERAKQDAWMREMRHNEKMKELQDHLNDVKGNGKSATRRQQNVMGIPAEIFKQIQTKGKQLRNSNLVIGHPKALWDAR